MAASAAGVRDICGSPWRVRISALGPWSCSMASHQATAVSTASAGPPQRQIRNQPQAVQVLDRLMRRTILAQADRVVGVDQDHALVHQRRHAHARCARSRRRSGRCRRRESGRRAARCRSWPRSCRTRARRSARSCREASFGSMPLARSCCSVLFEAVRSAEPPSSSGSARTDRDSARPARTRASPARR